ncbi:MAG: glutamate-1-semialdehyde 2,1-aminomutase, partial [Candidatus Sumerlaeaceae bacterium]|nr:glutamate-1-semialdehyde 2,1-aminomutase [Candidatus Sumerlaeaceae bacterium]
MAGEESRSVSLFQSAREVIPGGVNSPVRAFNAVGGTPPFIASGKGSRITDVDGREYIDYVGSYGPLLFGHAPDFIVDAITRVAQDGTCFGAPTALETDLARMVREAFPAMEMVRFVNSGGEATSSAVRLARGVTGRRKIVKCAGCYHGSVDSLMVKAGSGVVTLGLPDTAGVTDGVASDTIVVEFNDVEALELVFRKWGNEIAALILEPIVGNMGLVPPLPGYLECCRRLTASNDALLILDEVMTGFRVARGGAQEIFGIKPDLVCLGKIVGGGTPVGAFGGKREIMELLAPAGSVYQA